MKALLLLGAVLLGGLAAVPWRPAQESGMRHRCPDLSWLRIRGLQIPMLAVDALENPPVPVTPPIVTLGDLTRTTKATLLMVLGGLSDGQAIVADIERQLRLLRLRLAR